MKKDNQTDREDRANKKPPATFEVVYCDKCGRDNRFQRLRTRHFRNAEFCVGGTLKSVTYRRDDNTVRSVLGEEVNDERE